MGIVGLQKIHGFRPYLCHCSDEHFVVEIFFAAAAFAFGLCVESDTSAAQRTGKHLLKYNIHTAVTNWKVEFAVQDQRLRYMWYNLL